jgi:2'-hydroxyisoflavone reductase
MKILIIGGSVFLGRHIVQNALERGHQVTMFNRGLHNPDLFPDVEKIRGDRNGDLSQLQGRSWDAVVDPSGYYPRSVRTLAELLKDSVDHYTFISSLSVYSDTSAMGIDESAPVGTLEDETIEEVTNESYGPLKALCEKAAEEVMPGRVLNVRAGLIVGPYDPSDRFTYWPHRIDRGGEVLAPRGPEVPTQLIDVRDLASWIVRMIETKGTGTFNGTGPDYRLTLGRIIDLCKEASGSNATITWADESFLLEQEVAPWMGLPLWLPDGEEYNGFNFFDISRAIASGLTFRPIEDTVRATLEWDRTLPERQLRAGITPEREEEILRLWRERAQAPVGE